jgi:uncharacterized protein YdeI (YjbR/CyaY-like superfamily)
MPEVQLTILDKKEFRNWLSENHDKEKKVGLIIHKKHTGKPSPHHKELMEEAICFGWIDTTLKRLDNDKYIRYFCRRSKNSSWSYNTLSYAKQLIKEKRMTPAGLVFYKLGLKKKPHDFGIPKNPDVPSEMKDVFNKNKKAKEAFENLAPSTKKNYLRWIVRAKLPETRIKRINSVIKIAAKSEKPWLFKDI